MTLMQYAARTTREASVTRTQDDPTYPLKRWVLPDPDPQAAAELARHLKISLVSAQILLNRGFTCGDLDAGRKFLRPQLADLIEPGDLPGIAPAADRIAKAVRDNEKITIYGDYDVDGITATAILWHALVTLGISRDKLGTYIPHRVDEGYGLNAEALVKLADEGANVIVSVDCGITACDQAILARERGVDLIITDHHEWRNTDGIPTLPDAFACVHPRLPGNTPYENPELTGAGVAFKLAWEVGKRLSGGPKVSDDMKWFLVDALALAALGTIADVAPLIGENRVIARYGLGGLTKTKLFGLRALIDSAGLGGCDLDSMDVGFKLAPRLNACGRMGHAQDAVEMLTAATPGRAKDIAEFLEGENRRRQTTERAITKQAIEQVHDNGWDSDDHRAIVVAASDWHVGVVGIVASRLVDIFHRPAIVLALDGEGGAGGSGRSIDGFHLAHALQSCASLLDSHGGHAMAAGMHLQAGNIDAFREQFVSLARADLSAEDLLPCLKADVEIDLSTVNAALETELSRLGPFGRGNPRPTLILRGLTVLTARAVGKTGDHLQLQLDDGTGRNRIKGIAFGCGELATKLRGGDKIDLAGSLNLNEWNGRTTVELEIKDVSPKKLGVRS